jgi:copper chaperone CopZ
MAETLLVIEEMGCDQCAGAITQSLEAAAPVAQQSGAR